MLVRGNTKKVDLGLVNSDGHGMPVPVNVELEVIRYIIGKRIAAVQADPSLLTWERPRRISNEKHRLYATRIHCQDASQTKNTLHRKNPERLGCGGSGTDRTQLIFFGGR
jgi:hypothetical protein